MGSYIQDRSQWPLAEDALDIGVDVQANMRRLPDIVTRRKKQISKGGLEEIHLKTLQEEFKNRRAFTVAPSLAHPRAYTKAKRFPFWQEFRMMRDVFDPFQLQTAREASKPGAIPGRILCLSNIFDQQYACARGEGSILPLTSAKRRDLFQCLELATGREVVVLSSPPKPAERKRSRWLPAVKTRFATHTQHVSENFDVSKLRIPAAWFFYAAHVARHARRGDWVLIDNYEFLYIVAVYAAKMRRRDLTFILDYEDGKHLITRGIDRLLSGAAEIFGRRLFSGALLAHPSLARRLPEHLPTLLVPGFVHTTENLPKAPPAVNLTKFVYSGSLDRTRGIDVLIGALAGLPRSGWEIHVTGDGPLKSAVAEVASDTTGQGHIHFHGILASDRFEKLLRSCDVALNCQRVSDPISSVTFPSKTFTYLSAGLGVISSTAGATREILGHACHYYEDDSAPGLADLMTKCIRREFPLQSDEAVREVAQRYSIGGTASRLQDFFAQVQAK